MRCNLEFSAFIGRKFCYREMTSCKTNLACHVLTLWHGAIIIKSHYYY